MFKSGVILGLVACLTASSAAALEYPTKPVKIVVPFAAGSSTDVVARIVANGLGEVWDKPVIVENRAGAFGLPGTTSAVAEAPDGGTLIVSSSSTHSSNPWLFKEVPYDVLKFSHITELFEVPMLLVLNPSLAAKTEQEFSAFAKGSASPIFYSYGSATQQVAAASYTSSKGIRAEPVPYKSPPQAITDLVSGQVQFMFADPGLALAFVQDGKLTALAVSSASRLKSLPSVPTFTELGISALNMRVWIGISAPPGMAPELVTRINQDIRKVMSTTKVQERLTALGMEVKTNSPEDFVKLIVEQKAIWGEKIKEAGIKPE
jgi:tripartite-type tricarboxylate transporter receptor subunit TctC